tara:strand:- start:1 stop:345 length:345 start_codon:yes stop_codon:yes gene_type:complete
VLPQVIQKLVVLVVLVHHLQLQVHPLHERVVAAEVETLLALVVLEVVVLADIMVVLMARLEVLILAAVAVAPMVETLLVELVVLVLLFFVWRLLATQAQQVVHLQLQHQDLIQY